MIKVDFDALIVGFGVVLIQDRKPIAYFNDKLNEVRKKNSKYMLNFMPLYRN